MNRAKRFCGEVAIQNIRKWVNEDSDSAEDDQNTGDSDSEWPEGSQNLELDSGSETEDCVLENASGEAKSEESSSEGEMDASDGEQVELDDESTGGRSEYGNQYKSRSGLIWKSTVPSSSKTKEANIVRESAGPKAAIKDKIQPLDIYRMFITEEMSSDILQYTNAEGRRRADAKQPPDTHWKIVTKDEIDAVNGLLFLCGLFGMSKVSLRRIWSKSPVQNPIFRAVMCGQRFEEILSLMRFDDKTTRDTRRAVDKFAPIRDLWNAFSHQCRTLYSPTAYVTVDEQLLGFRGKCPFRQYIKSKPDKYGIKLWLCSDAQTYYVFNMNPYLGREESRDNATTHSLGTRVVLGLVEPLSLSGRNITCDNLFTNVQLADILYEKKLTLLGTMRKSNRDIPSEFLANRKKEAGSSMFAFSGTKAMVSYVPKRNRAVVLLSTMHNDDKLNETTKKPDIIMDYNRTKGGVDTVDQLCHKYTTKRSTRRWPMCVFYGMIDIAAVNSFVIFLHNNPAFNPKATCKRRMFLEKLAMDLIKPQLEYRRAHSAGLSGSILSAMSVVGYPCLAEPKPPRQMPTRAATLKRKRCVYCPTKIDRKVYTECSICQNRVCPDHSTKTTNTVCVSCV